MKEQLTWPVVMVRFGSGNIQLMNDFRLKVQAMNWVNAKHKEYKNSLSFEVIGFKRNKYLEIRNKHDAFEVLRFDIMKKQDVTRFKFNN